MNRLIDSLNTIVETGGKKTASPKKNTQKPEDEFQLEDDPNELTLDLDDDVDDLPCSG